jgi:amidase
MLAYASLIEVAEQIRRKQLSPVEITNVILSRIAQHDEAITSYITVLHERALYRARVAEAEIARGYYRGPLHGVPIAIKDLCDTSFAPTTSGMQVHAKFRPARDATVVKRLETAGAVILGKLAMNEGALGNHHPMMPTPRNPWSASHWTGGSSSGSGAATAAGFCYAALGSDTGGSVRFPASACGLTGVKPTWGRVSRHGIFPLAESLDTVGPLARNAADAAALLGTIAGMDDNDPTCLDVPVLNYVASLDEPIFGVKLGMDECFVSEGADPYVIQTLHAAAQALVSCGARIVPCIVPSADRLLEGFTTLCFAEAAVAHRDTYPAQAHDYTPELARYLDEGRCVSGPALAQVHIERQKYAGRLAAVFRDVDLLIMPVAMHLTPRLEHLPTLAAEGVPKFLRFTAPFNMSGNPAITLQGGFDSHGVPVGFQLIGRHLSEPLLLRAAHAFQTVTDWHTRHPAL